MAANALNASLPQIYDEFEEDGVKKRVLNAADTEAAKDKLMKTQFGVRDLGVEGMSNAPTGWRGFTTTGSNNLVPRHFDGSILTILGYRPNGVEQRVVGERRVAKAEPRDTAFPSSRKTWRTSSGRREQAIG